MGFVGAKNKAMAEADKSLIEQAIEIKKAKGKEAALDFLLHPPVPVPINSDLVSYLDRIKIYATGSQKYRPEIILGVFDQLISKMKPENIWEGYNQKGEMLERYSLMQDALRNYSMAISNLSPYNSNYLGNLSMLERKFARLCNTNHDSVYYSIFSDLLLNAINLFYVIRDSGYIWLASLEDNNHKQVKPSFTLYLMQYRKPYCGFYDILGIIESLKEINPSLSAIHYRSMLIKMMCSDYPSRLGFKQEYFKPDYNSENFFNELFQVYGKDFEKIYPSKAVYEATEIVNEFLKGISQ